MIDWVNNKKGLRRAAALLLTAIILVTGCTNTSDEGPEATTTATIASKTGGTESNTPQETAISTGVGYEIDEQPGDVYYEIFVRSFYDTNEDGIGDLNGVTAKLDYLKELGIGGIWLMPINPSPSYHGYDVTDYYGVNPDYGTLDDMKKLLDEAHKRDIKVIIDLVVNHTSSEHPWFKEALADPESPYRNWYQFVDADEKVQNDGATGSKPWHTAGDSKYLGIFWGGMPDLNFDEPAVRAEMVKIGQYWLELGLDGFRLDAAKHIYGDFNSTVNSKEVWAANKQWWQDFRSRLNETKPDAFLIGEVWDSMSVIAPYFDHALDSAFHFDLAGKIEGAASGERNPDIAFTLKRAYDYYGKTSGNTFTDSPFLSNHDQNRIMTALTGNINHAKMAASLLLTLPGNPFIYYGEEIGMEGAKPDEFIREPMLWYANKAGGKGQTNWEPSKHNPDPMTVSVEAQQKDENSILAHYQMLNKWRYEEPALQNGSIEDYVITDAPAALSTYIRLTAKERVLVAHNLSGTALTVELTADKRFEPFGTLQHASSTEAKLEKGKLTLPPYSTVILK